MRVATVVAIVACAFAAAASANLLSKVEHKVERAARVVASEAAVGSLPLCGSLSGSNAVVAFTFASAESCQAYANQQVAGGSIGGTWNNCSSATFCTGFSYGFVGTVVGFPVVGVSMFNIGSGSFTFDSAATTKVATTSYSDSYLPATLQKSGTGITVSGDCGNTYGSFSLPSAPASNTSIWAFNFASC
eukprot:CAMPEP_0174837488 /NCGR_PEP_ID=MMETSP1114-20130205/6782_1 /TAXON_ID=312471 /ORGANISM="Neobodo designis, Strain CCAP 1951/1" /LENGTH=188 /DNA_ID=CAMNT_0016071555 /DNA_START=37 /DNA_END=603 /DNA_ORIENTATION=+